MRSTRAFLEQMDIFRTRSTESWPVAQQKRASDAGPFANAPGMIRTCDLCLRRAALYPLSYGRPVAQCSRDPM
jgi:hypothetical protein